MWARIDTDNNNTVAEIIDFNPEGKFHPSLVWKEIGDENISIGWEYRDGKFYPPVPQKPYIPQKVTRAQGKAALFSAGLLSLVEDYIESLVGEERVRASLAFNETNEWRRDSPFLAQAASVLGLSEQQLDNLFLVASNIVL